MRHTQYQKIKQQVYWVSGLLTKCEVKMAGYILAKFFMDGVRVTDKAHKIAKTEQGQYPAILTSLVNKEFLIWLLVKFFLQDTTDSTKLAR